MRNNKNFMPLLLLSKVNSLSSDFSDSDELVFSKFLLFSSSQAALFNTPYNKSNMNKYNIFFDFCIFVTIKINCISYTLDLYIEIW